jgi:hypothetical protein
MYIPKFSTGGDPSYEHTISRAVHEVAIGKDEARVGREGLLPVVDEGPVFSCVCVCVCR